MNAPNQMTWAVSREARPLGLVSLGILWSLRHWSLRQRSFRRRRDVLRAPRFASLPGLLEKLFNSLCILLLQCQLKFLQVLDEHAQHAGQIPAVGQRDVAPHLRRAGGDARGVAKSGGAKHRLLPGIDRKS